jgi:dihydrodipicolinate synthase/N-acetylneuraminate lyase
MLHALQSGDFAKAEAIRERFNLLESLRNAHGPIPVLHEAVALAGIADTGPILPLLAKLDGGIEEPIRAAASGLLAWNQS